MSGILIIDDSEAMLGRMALALRNAGYEVITTSQTVGAARFLKRCDLVIIDFYMPGLDGQAVVESLRHSARSVGTQPLFYLYSSDPTLGPRHRQLGFDGYFAAKGDEESLLAQVRSAFRLRDLRRMRQPT